MHKVFQCNILKYFMGLHFIQQKFRTFYQSLVHNMNFFFTYSHRTLTFNIQDFNFLKMSTVFTPLLVDEVIPHNYLWYSFKHFCSLYLDVYLSHNYLINAKVRRFIPVNISCRQHGSSICIVQSITFNRNTEIQLSFSIFPLFYLLGINIFIKGGEFT